MAKLVSPEIAIVGKSYFPCFISRIVLGLFGAVPLSLRYPYIPSRSLTKSSFLYCLSIYGLTLWSSYHSVSYVLERMEFAKPFNHFLYIVSFEMMITQTLLILPIVSWFDTSAFTATINAWYQFIDKYEEIIKKPIPNSKTREWVLQTMIIISVPVALFTGEKLMQPHLKWKAEFVPSVMIPATLLVTFIHHWTGYYLELETVANDLSKRLKQAAAEKNLFTPKLVEEYKTLWILLRNILGKMSEMKIHLCVSILLSVCSTLTLFEGLLLYLNTGSVSLTAFNMAVNGYNVLPIVHCCRAGQRATDKVQFLFEDSMSCLKLSSVSDVVQKQICIIYLMKRTKKPVATLCDFAELNLPLMLATFSTITMYIFIMLQFHQVVS